jgi:hypothetical protein
MTNKIRILLFCALVVPISLKAQKLEVSFRAFPSSWYNGYFEPAIDGGGLAVSYLQSLSEKMRLIVTAEYDLLRERNECYSGLGIFYQVWGNSRLSVQAGASLLNGISLYRPDLLYTGGAEASARIEYKLKGKTSVGLSLGARYTACPAYKEYGVWQHNAWPVGLSIRF